MSYDRSGRGNDSYRDQDDDHGYHDRDEGIEPRSAREAAFAALREFDMSGAFLGDSLDRLPVMPLSPPDRALAMELCYTVMRRRATIDVVLRALVTRDPDNVEPDLWLVLELGIAQLLLIEGLPQHAAVHETVELAKRLNPRWGGMTNGVLRSLQRMLKAEMTDQPAANAVPLVDVEPALEGSNSAQVSIRYRVLDKNLFPDPVRNRTGYIAAAFSMPRELIERWSHAWDGNHALQTAAWFTTPGVMSLRVNLLKTNREAVLQSLQEAGIECWAGAYPESIRLKASTRISRLPGFEDGLFTIQDESAMGIVDRLNPQPGWTVLDLCSAPGGKTTHMAERMKDQGSIIACDLSPRRLKMVNEAAWRLGLNSIRTQPVTKEWSSVPEGPFDAALVDAQCSNTGVLGKRPEARWRLSDADFEDLPVMQLEVLSSAAAVVREGGRLAYSTCSIDAMENEGVVRKFLSRSPEWSLIEQVTTLPGEPFDGGFVAILQKGEKTS